MAMPIKLPIDCSVFKIPEASPDFSLGAELSTVVKMAVINKPPPAPAMI